MAEQSAQPVPTSKAVRSTTDLPWWRQYMDASMPYHHLPSVRAGIWKNCNYAARVGILNIVVNLALCDLSWQKFLPAPSLAVIFGQIIAGTAKSTGQAILMAIMFGTSTMWICIISIPFGSGFSRLDDELQRALTPPVMFIVCFLVNLSLPGLLTSVIFVVVGDAIVMDSTWPDVFPLQMLLTIIVGLAFAPAVHMLPLPYPDKSMYYLRPSSDYLEGRDCLRRAREMAAALVQHLADITQDSGLSLAPALHLEAKLREAVEKLQSHQLGAGIEMALVCRKAEFARHSAWVARLIRQVKYLTILTKIAQDGDRLLQASPVARAGIERNRPLMLALAKAIVTDTADGSVPSLKAEVAALKEASTAARAELLQSIVSEHEARTETNTKADMKTTAGTSLLTNVYLHALLALCGVTDEDVAGELTAHLQLDSPAAPAPSALAKLRAIFGPPPFDTSVFGIRRSLAYGLAMGIAALWLTEPTLISSSSGHGSWVGITVGAVHIAGADQSIAKTGNRMVGTLIAAGFTLFILNSTLIEYIGAWLPILSVWISACYYWSRLVSDGYFYIAQVAAFTATIFLIQPGTVSQTTAPQQSTELPPPQPALPLLSRAHPAFAGCILTSAAFTPLEHRCGGYAGESSSLRLVRLRHLHGLAEDPFACGL